MGEYRLAEGARTLAKHQREQRERFENLFKLNGAGSIHCRLDESYVKKLLGYFKARI